MKTFTNLTIILLVIGFFYGFSTTDKIPMDNHPNNNANNQKGILQEKTSTDNPPSDYSFFPQTSGTTSQLLSVSAVSKMIGWAAGLNSTVLRTVNAGINWTNANGSGITGDVYNICAIDSSTAFCTTTPNSTYIYKTTDGGMTWTQVFSQSGGFINAIKMVTATQGYAVGDPVGGKWTVLKTTNTGNTWTRMTTEPAQVGFEAGWSNSFCILGTHMWFGTNSTRVYHSSNLGLTWTSGATAGITNTFAVHYNSVTTGLAGGNGMVRSLNSGASYSLANLPYYVGNIYGIEGDSAQWWTVGSSPNIYWSTDVGYSWTSVYSAVANLNSVDFAKVNNHPTGWFVGDGGTIVRMLRNNTHDVGALLIKNPAGNEWFVGNTTNPTVSFTNWGTETETFNVRLIIPPEYSADMTVNNLQPGHEVDVDFPLYTASVPGIFMMTSYTRLETDMDRLDDTTVRRLVVYNHDVGPSLISNPPSQIGHPSTHTPQATVTNFGNFFHPETFNVTMTITPGSYTSTKQVTNLPAGNSVTVNFDSYTTPGPGEYMITVTTQLYNDQNTSNDSRSRQLIVSNHDVAVNSLGYYTGLPEPGFIIPEAGILNEGSETETFNVTAEITPGTYSSTRTISGLTPGSGTTIFFDSCTILPGMKMTIYTQLYEDQDRFNDTGRMDVICKDVGPSLISNPPSPIGHPSTHTPQATVTNFGNTTETFNVSMTITPGSYTSTKQVTNLAAGGSVQVDFDSYPTPGPGAYMITVTTQLNGDENISNDSRSRELTVGTHDVGPSSIINPPDEIGHPSTHTPQASITNYGSATETFNVTMTISPGPYSSTKTVTSLPAGASITVDFAPYSTTGAGTFTITVTTQLYGDQNTSNDLRSRGLTINIHDVGTISIDNPKNGAVGSAPVCATYALKATFKNFGSVTENFFDVKFEITGPDGVPHPYTRAVLVLAPGATIQVDFGNFEPPEGGLYTFRVYTQLLNDGNEANDLLPATFNVDKVTAQLKFEAKIFPEGNKTSGREKVTVRACNQQVTLTFAKDLTEPLFIARILAQINVVPGFKATAIENDITIEHKRQKPYLQDPVAINITYGSGNSPTDAGVCFLSKYSLWVSGIALGGTVSFTNGNLHASINTTAGQTSLGVVNALSAVLDSIVPQDDTSYSYNTLYNVDSSSGLPLDPIVLGIWQLGNRDLNSSTFVSTDPGITMTLGGTISASGQLYTDNFDGPNDVASLESRGYKIYRMGTGQPGSQSWYNGDSSVYPAFNGPAAGYVQGSYQCIAPGQSGSIDNWLVLLKRNIQTGNALKFFSRARGNSNLADSLMVMYSAVGDSVPEAASWVELGRFKVNTSGWERKEFIAPTSGTNARFAIRYTIANGGPNGNASDYFGIDGLSIEISSSPKIAVDMKVLIEGFYNPVQNLQFGDNVKVNLRNATSPYSIVDSSSSFVNWYGNAIFNFLNADGGTYYLEVRHRNSIETWSKNGGISLTPGTIASYDFTTAQSQAYGNNLKLKGTKWCIYSGDVNQDGTVDATDLSLIDNAASNFVAGYAATDLDGNSFVDASDAAVADNNAFNFVTKITP